MSESDNPSDDVLAVVGAALDPVFYRGQLSELGSIPDPVSHYATEGWRAGLDPTPYFSTADYLDRSPDVRSSGVNPFYHYLRWGRAEGRLPKAPDASGDSPAAEPPSEVEVAIRDAFDAAFYCEQHPDIVDNHVDPVKHYAAFGWRLGYDPTPWFSTTFYLERSPDVRAQDVNPFFHYLRWGRTEGRLPAAADALASDPDVEPPSDIERVLRDNFDEEFYRTEHPQIAANHVDPVKHYVAFGWRLGYDPSPEFSTSFYLERSSDVRDKKVNPFYHYLRWGKLEGRLAKPMQDVGPEPETELPSEIELLVRKRFDDAFYCAQHPDISGNHVDPLKHYLVFGWRLGYDPTRWFSTKFYLGRSPDVAALDLNPFYHYLRWGRLEGRLPAPAGAEESDPDLEPPSEIEPVIRANLDAEFYQTEHPEIAANHIDPVKHYIAFGWRLGYDPAPGFSTSFYLERNPDVRAAGVNPFYHFLQAGRLEGRSSRAHDRTLARVNGQRVSQFSVLFVLPTSNIAGGVNSVVQEAIGLARLGVDTQIAVKNQAQFAANYPELDRFRVKIGAYANSDELAALAESSTITIATTNASVFDVNGARGRLKEKKAAGPKIAYYVQDYEPLFYTANSERWSTAYRSYNLIDGAVLFAKTKWLQDIVYANHGIRVAKVAPSLDHDIFYPDLERSRERLSVTAMLRPQTPRRAPKRTIRIMKMLSAQLGDAVDLQVFGCDPVTLGALGIELPPQIRNFGVLLRHEVPAVLRASDLFLDLSDYQAFGRTGLESMACGCTPVLPVLGGTAEFALHGRNAYVVDTRSDEAIMAAVNHFVAMSQESRIQMRQSALETAANFTIMKAALSEFRLFHEMTVQ